MNKSMPTKVNRKSRFDHDSKLNSLISELEVRLDSNRATLEQGYISAPAIQHAVSLGVCYKGSDNVIPIYKINVPGYFFVRQFGGDYTSDGEVGAVVSNDPNNLLETTTLSAATPVRMMYWGTGACKEHDDNVNGHANNMFPITPCSTTYATIIKATNKDVKREILFVPTVAAVSMNIDPNDYIIQVGTTTESTTAIRGQDNVIGTVSNRCLGGRGNTSQPVFKSVGGYWVADESKVVWLDDAFKTAYLERRNARLREQGII